MGGVLWRLLTPNFSLETDSQPLLRLQWMVERTARMLSVAATALQVKGLPSLSHFETGASLKIYLINT